jgi:hypothetical protein
MNKVVSFAAAAAAFSKLEHYLMCIDSSRHYRAFATPLVGSILQFALSTSLINIDQHDEETVVCCKTNPSDLRHSLIYLSVN